MEASPALKEQVSILEEQVGTYETVKGSLMEIEEESDVTDEDFSEITFYSDASVKLYDIDSAYIDQLLGTYAANSSDVREELEKALQKLNKTEQVKDVYRSILTAIDQHQVPENEDIFSLKRHFFTQERNQQILAFAHEWFVSEEELQSSAMQYMIGMDPIPNMGAVIESKNYEGYKSIHSEMKPFKYPQVMKRAWRHVLDEAVIPLEDELR